MRILLTWELGLNLGHLTRLLPIAQELKAEGHSVLVAVRDIQAAATVLGPSGISFVQAPHLPRGIALPHRASGYADILLSQGWSDQAALWGLTQGWLNLFRMFRPDKLVLDYSPTVLLAARVAKVPAVLVGNGFELPPATDPLPCFPGFSWATPERAAQSEASAVVNANVVLKALGGERITGLSSLFLAHTCLLATFPELDHYGNRGGAQYIGPLLGELKAPPVEWPEGQGPKIFAVLRPDTCHVQEILSALAMVRARVICVATGFARQQLMPFVRGHVRFALTPVDLNFSLDANLCITYGAEGTMLRFIMAGVPQLISPWHVETFMTVRRVAAARLGYAISTPTTSHSIRATIECIAASNELRGNAVAFAARTASYALGKIQLLDLLTQRHAVGGRAPDQGMPIRRYPTSPPLNEPNDAKAISSASETRVADLRIPQVEAIAALRL